MHIREGTCQLQELGLEVLALDNVDGDLLDGKIELSTRWRRVNVRSKRVHVSRLHCELRNGRPDGETESVELQRCGQTGHGR